MPMTNELHRNKQTVRRLVEQVINGGQLGVIDEVFSSSAASGARQWIEPFLASFPDVRMEIVELIAEGDTVAGRFTCSATHTGTWLNQPPTGRRFVQVDEVGIYRLHQARITQSWSLEDNLSRLRQLGLIPPAPGPTLA